MKNFIYLSLILVVFFWGKSGWSAQGSPPEISSSNSIKHPHEQSQIKDGFAYYQAYRVQGQAPLELKSRSRQYENGHYFEDEDSNITKIYWQGPSSILPYLEKGSCCQNVELIMNFDKDELTNDLFLSVLNLKPKVLTLVNNSRGMAKDFDISSLIGHFHFADLQELNFRYCYHLDFFFQDEKVARKITRLTWGALTRKNIFQAVPKEIAAYDQIKELNFGGVFLDEMSDLLAHVTKILTNKPYLKVFLGDFMGISLSKWLSMAPKTSSLNDVDVSVSLNDDLMSYNELLEYLQRQKKLKTVSINLVGGMSQTSLTPDPLNLVKVTSMGQLIVLFLKQASALSKIYLSNLSLTADQWEDVGQALRGYQNLQVLFLRSCNLDDGAVKHLAPALKKNFWLRELSFEGAGITDEGAKILLENQGSHQLEYLDVSHCQLLTHPASLVREYLAQQNYLENLWATSYALSHEDILAFIQGRDGKEEGMVTVHVGEQENKSTFARDTAVMILEEIRKKNLLSSGGRLTIRGVPYEPNVSNSEMKNYLIFSHISKICVKLLFSPHAPLIPINSDDPKSNIPQEEKEQGVQGEEMIITEHKDDENLEKIVREDNQESSPVLSSPKPPYGYMAWLNPLSYWRQ